MEADAGNHRPPANAATPTTATAVGFTATDMATRTWGDILTPQRPVDLIPSRMEPLHAIPIIDRPAHKLVERDGLLEMRHHGTKPDQLALSPHPCIGPAKLYVEHSRGQIPEPRRVQARRDVVHTKRPEI